MTVVSNTNAALIVLQYCELQRRLIERFLEVFQPKDLERFSDVERKGILQIGLQIWRYTRHGVGILFQHSDVIIDAHVGLTRFPDAIDGWRLLQYLESINVLTLGYNRELFAANNEKSLEAMLAKMVDAGILQEVYLQVSTRLFRPVALSSGIKTTLELP